MLKSACCEILILRCFQTAFLCTIGGRDISTKVSRILRYLFTDALASEFSFYGKRLNKRPFSDLCLKTVIVGAYISLV